MEASRVVSVSFVCDRFFQILFSLKAEERLEILHGELFHGHLRQRRAHVFHRAFKIQLAPAFLLFRINCFHVYVGFLTGLRPGARHTLFYSLSSARYRSRTSGLMWRALRTK